MAPPLQTAACTAAAFFSGFSSKDLLIAVGWSITAIGWYVSSSQANKRERRKEARAEIDACAKLAHELAIKAREYYTKSPEEDSNRALGRQIRFEFMRLTARCQRLERKHPKCDLEGTLGELMDSLTGGDFESSARQPIKFDDLLLEKIDGDVHALIDELEEGFINTFR